MSLTTNLFGIPHSNVGIVGGGSGIGRAVTQALSVLGVDVWIFGRGEENVGATAELCKNGPGRVQFTTCDVREIDSAGAAFAKAAAFVPLTGLVHGAGQVWPCAAERLTNELFSDVVATQMVGTLEI